MDDMMLTDNFNRESLKNLSSLSCELKKSKVKKKKRVACMCVQDDYVLYYTNKRNEVPHPGRESTRSDRHYGGYI